MGANAEKLREMMAPAISDLREVVIVPEMGHWIQQEDSATTNNVLLNFLDSLYSH